MKKIIVMLTLVVFSMGAFAQETPDSLAGWEKGAVATLNFSQVSLTNWAAGGQNSLSGVALFNGFMNYKEGKWSWDNMLDIAYGMTKTGKDPWVKNEDRIDFASKVGRSVSKNWNYSGLLGFKTQFAKGYELPHDANYISKLMAPGYLTISLGMDYKPCEHFSMFVSPLTTKMTFVMDDYLSALGAFGVEPGKKFRPELGGYVKFAVAYDVMKNVNVQSKLDLFSNYLHNPQNIDVSWDVLVSMKINKFMTATLSTNLIYDDDIDIAFKQDDGTIKKHPAIQFKEMFGLGISYTF